MNLIEHRKYATDVIACEAKKGICHIKGCCEECDTAKKYKFNTELFKLVEACDRRTLEGLCCISCEKCVQTDCGRLILAAGLLV